MCDAAFCMSQLVPQCFAIQRSPIGKEQALHLHVFQGKVIKKLILVSFSLRHFEWQAGLEVVYILHGHQISFFVQFMKLVFLINVLLICGYFPSYQTRFMRARRRRRYPHFLI